MKKESVALAVAGVLFGFLAGWIIGAQQGRPASAPIAPVQQAAAAGPGGDGAAAGQPPPAEAPKFDQGKVDALRQRATDNPKDAAVRAEIGLSLIHISEPTRPY